MRGLIDTQSARKEVCQLPGGRRTRWPCQGLLLLRTPPPLTRPHCRCCSAWQDREIYWHTTAIRVDRLSRWVFIGLYTLILVVLSVWDVQAVPAASAGVSA